METKKLYYEDSHRTSFPAEVVSCAEAAGGWEVILDQTAFYPTGGGQPCDLGTLGQANVLDVKEADGTIVHLCDAPVAGPVEGAIDWNRRFDFMQQHSGEHIVSGLVHGKYGYHNVGFHMGEHLVTIDFDGPLTWEQLMEIEEAANAVIWENRKVRVWYPTPEELPTVPYRTKKVLPWPVRIVEFPGVDLCACCGTQVKETGEIGLVKFISCVKFKEGVRIEMASGRRAMDYFRSIFHQNRQVSQVFSAKLLETGAAAQRFSELLAQEKFRATGLQWKVFEATAASFAGREKAVHFEEDLQPGQVRELADTLLKYVPTAVVCSGSDEAGYAVCILSTVLDTRQLGKEINEKLSGRGGGKPGSYQGSVKATRGQIEAFFNL